MGIATGLMLFGILWWTVLFAVLPFGVHSQEETGYVEPGTEASAPANHRLALKFAVTTGVTAVLWLIIFLMVELGVVNFRPEV